MAAEGSWTIAVTGASGLVGQALRRSAEGERIVPMVRDRARAGSEGLFWDPSRGDIDAAGLEGVDAVVHLAGENLASGRWTAERKARIRDSRVDGTRLVAETLAKLERGPQVLISASAVGYYGHRGDTPVHEDSAPGEGFLAETCKLWETSTAAAQEAGLRVVNMRMGVVLSPGGGALAKMLPLFKLGLGGRIGRGDQYMSWIALDDAVRALRFALRTDTMTGPVNAVAPNPVTNAELARTLGRVLGRPAVLPAPGFAVKAAMGREMAEDTLLGGQRVVPKRLADAGFEWHYPELESALRHVLGR